MLLLTAAFFAVPAWAGVELRVEAKPTTDDMQAFVTVTDDATGDPVAGLTANDFTVRLDGVTISSPGFTQPPAQSTQRLSVVFVMDYSPSVRRVARAAMETAVINFIDTMTDGDMAAIIKFTDTGGIVLVQEFTEIDHMAGSAALISAAGVNHTGDGSPILDAIDLATNHMIATFNTLPAGPKAIIVVTDGAENSSASTQSAVVANASSNSIPVFTIGVGNIYALGGLELLTFFAADTGGMYFSAPSDAEIAAAYVAISELLNNEYLLIIPFDAITDCAEHTLAVTVTGQAASGNATFARCDTTPDPFSFPNKTGVDRGAVVTSNPVTILGIDAPAQISVTGGSYSKGCGNTFTATAGTISKNDTVCVQHTASTKYDSSQATLLSVGGVSATFTSITAAAPPKNSGGGGGGATGIGELLLGLAALMVRRRRHSKRALPGHSAS
jgi:VWFA-related protein